MYYYPPKRKAITKRQRQEVFEKYNGHCAYCGCEITMKSMQVDHLIPMEMYEAYKTIGKDIDTMENYMPACRGCNAYKSTYSLEHFREMIERQTDILMRDRATYRLSVRFEQVIPNKHRVEFYFEKMKEREKDNG